MDGSNEGWRFYSTTQFRSIIYQNDNTAWKKNYYCKVRVLNCCLKRVNWYVREQHAIMKQHSVTGWFGQMHLTEGANGKKHSLVTFTLC